MSIQDLPLGFHERVTFHLRTLYNRYGYTQYKMSKFEEYDLYARNKDFLISDSVITFMDLNGKLMALKPDVTLSIVKNSKDIPDTVQKLYYNENIYRVNKGSGTFREMMQIGLECLGNIDAYCISEVLTLAAESLRTVSKEAVLNISHLGILCDFLHTIGISQAVQSSVLKAVSEKNLHELEKLCADCGVSQVDTELLKALLQLKGAPDVVLPKIQELLSDRGNAQMLQELGQVVSLLAASDIQDTVRIDFSVVDDTHYYNGIVFKGFLAGLPSSVLSGGQYDKLMQKLNRKSSAIGFAVYMDALERLEESADLYDADILVLYEDAADLLAVQQQICQWRKLGNSVMLQRSIPENIHYRQLCKIIGGEVRTLENNA